MDMVLPQVLVMTLHVLTMLQVLVGKQLTSLLNLQTQLLILP